MFNNNFLKKFKFGQGFSTRTWITRPRSGWTRTRPRSGNFPGLGSISSIRARGWGHYSLDLAPDFATPNPEGLNWNLTSLGCTIQMRPQVGGKLPKMPSVRLVKAKIPLAVWKSNFSPYHHQQHRNAKFEIWKKFCKRHSHLIKTNVRKTK